MDPTLRARWLRLVAPLGVDEAEAIRTLRDLWRRYDEPHRAYHTLSHIRHVLDVADFLAPLEGVSDPTDVRLAAWFHDAVHDPGAADNERRSAELARTVLTGWGLPEAQGANVHALVEATGDHLADAPEQAVLVDADLAILAADPPTYEVYRRAVRVEHAAADEVGWAAGRAAVLQDLLARDPIYVTAAMRTRGEAAARRNLTAELATLRGS